MVELSYIVYLFFRKDIVVELSNIVYFYFRKDIVVELSNNVYLYFAVIGTLVGAAVVAPLLYFFLWSAVSNIEVSP